MIRIGQIGIGHNHGAAKMKTLRKFPELFEVVGFSEESEEWMEKRGNLAAYEGLPRLPEEELIAKCDALLIETEVKDLTQTAQRCVDAGKHILMDKPASGTLAEFKHLLDTAKEKNLVVQLGYMYRYNPGVKECLQRLERGELGEVHSINAEMSACDPVTYKDWLNTFPGGGMYIFGSHMLDLVIRILGKPEKVHTFYKKSMLDGVELADNCLAVLEYPRALARIYNSEVEVNGYGRRQFVVCGSKGTANIMPMENPCRMTWSDLEIAHHHHKVLQVDVELAETTPSNRYDEEMQSFHDYVTGAKVTPWTYAHEYMVQEVLMEIVGGADGKNSD